MTITIEINEQEIADHVKKIVSENIASQLTHELCKGDSLSYRYHTEVREIIREVMKANYDALAREAVSAAAKSIENKAFKSKVLKLLEE